MDIEHPKEKLKSRLIFILLIVSVLFLVIFLFAHYRSINTRKPNIKDVINGSKLHVSLIKSGKLNYTIEYAKTELGAKYEKEIQEEGHASLLSQLYDVTYYFEDDKFRYNICSRAVEWLSLNNQEEEIKARIEYIYDGETATRIDHISGNISANITNYIDHLYPYTASIKPWGMELNSKPLAETLQYSDSRIIGFEDLHGESCYIIEIKPSIDIGGYFKIWVNPKRGYLVQKLEAIQKDKKKPSYTIENEFKEYSDGIWFPSYGIRKSKSEKNGKEEELEKTMMKVHELQINIDIPDDVFKPVFEKGTIVHDNRTDETYTVK